MSTTGSGSVKQEQVEKPAYQLEEQINLKVKSQDGLETIYRIKRSTQLQKLMIAYCEEKSVDLNAIVFLFDGRRLRAEQTPDQLEMKDDDEIDVMMHQIGGWLLFV